MIINHQSDKKHDWTRLSSIKLPPNSSLLHYLVAKISRATVPKAAVPKRDEKPIHGLVSDKNFIVANAVENILAGKCLNYSIYC